MSEETNVCIFIKIKVEKWQKRTFAYSTYEDKIEGEMFNLNPGNNIYCNNIQVMASLNRMTCIDEIIRKMIHNSIVHNQDFFYMQA